MAESNNKTYENGLVDAMRMWGNVCGSEGGCNTCPIAAVRGTGLTCQEFAKKAPEKMVSLLTDLDKREHTYFSEYNMRFPNAQVNLEDLAGICCRKGLFEGYYGCSDYENLDKCKACWLEPFTGDVTVVLEEDQTDNINQTIENMSQFLN